ncbi:MAG: histidine kinase [Actinomycetota bacterium]
MVAARRLAWGLLFLAIAIATAGMVLVVLNDSGALEQSVFVLIFMAMALVGALIASRRPENAIGWLMIGFTLMIAMAFVGEGAAIYSFETNPGAIPGARWLAWVGGWGWAAGIGPMITFLFLPFPDGHLPSRRWRPFGWAIGVLIVALVVLAAVDPNLEMPGGASNPLGIEASGQGIEAAVGIGFLLLVVFAVASVASLIARYRRSVGDEREQIKWLMFAGGLLAIWIALQTIGTGAGIPWLVDSFAATALSALAFLAIPLAVGIAMLRHRFYDVNLVIRKTVVVALLVAFISLVYIAIVVGLGAAFFSTSSGGPLPIIAAVVIALAFQPVRARANRLANRLILGERATPYEVLSAFSERLSGTYATEDLLPRMARILGEGTRAQRAEVWLRVGDSLRPAAAWPSGAESTPTAAPLVDGEMPPLNGSRALPVRHEGELLGAISVTKPPSEPLSHEEEQLLEHLAAQAGLVLRNAGLTEELRARLDELQASRQRIVAAQDQERRRLERDLHDGAQQQLVALAVKQRMAEMFVGKDPERAVALLSELQADTAAALDNLRDLARGIYPPLLADKGLPAALEAQASKAAVSTRVVPDGVGRYPQEAEAAVYFCCLEALQNVGKYAEASNVVVTLHDEGDALTFAVQDDGRGFDPSSAPPGSGMQNMKDRLAALGGTFEVRSSPGDGTTIQGRIPVRAAGSG